MTADVLQFDRGCAMLRGPDAEAARRRRIKIRRTAAYRRALADEYTKADLAMFGPAEQLLRDGPGEDPGLSGRGGGGPRAA